MHADQLQAVAKRHDGEMPASWVTGGTPYQKAAVIAAVAWHQIKSPDDPEFTKCDLTFRETCIAVVESIMTGNIADELPFAQKAAALWAEVKDGETEGIQKGMNG